MRKLLIVIILFIIFLVILLPLVIVNNLNFFKTQIETDEKVLNITVLFHETGEIKLMPLEEYLIGVVAAEMPAEFELEALKAQAVAARTYTLKKMQLKSKNAESDHPNAVVCTDPAHCQAWISKEEQKELWGVVNYLKYRSKIESAVKSTEGQIITYDKRIIDPVYHSNCGGKTENSEDVWKFKIPYLRSVESPYSIESPRYKETKTYSMEYLDKALGTNIAAVPAASIKNNVSQYFKILEKTSSGRIKKIYIGGKTILTTQLRQILNLRSTKFEISIIGDMVKFTTYGYGHGVGMCQYGANGFAKNGKNYMEIIKHYYKGVEIQKYKV
jgi:stage II sporulation protein D